MYTPKQYIHLNTIPSNNVQTLTSKPLRNDLLRHKVLLFFFPDNRKNLSIYKNLFTTHNSPDFLFSLFSHWLREKEVNFILKSLFKDFSIRRTVSSVSLLRSVGPLTYYLWVPPIFSL